MGTIVFAVIAFGVAAALAWPASGPYRADHSYRLALIAQNQYQQVSQSQQQQQQQAAPQYLGRAQSEFGHAIAANPWEASYIESRGRLVAAQAQANVPKEGSAGNPTEAVRLYRESLKDYERAVGLQPRNPYILSAYADVLLKIGELDNSDTTSRPKAIQALRDATAGNPWRLQPWQLLGALLANNNDPSGALAVAEKALVYFPGNVDVLRQAATAAEKLGDKEKAKAYWEKIVVAAPSDQQARSALGLPAATTTAEASTSSG